MKKDIISETLISLIDMAWRWFKFIPYYLMLPFITIIMLVSPFIDYYRKYKDRKQGKQ